MFSSTLTQLRVDSGMSQEKVANKLKIARATYSNLETGKRSPTLEQIQAIADLFEMKATELINPKLNKQKTEKELAEIVFEETVSDIQPREIIEENVETLREVLLYVLDKVGGKPNVGETVLYKLLYFIDFDYYEKTGKSITGLKYIRNHYGPTPTKTFASVVKAMEDSEELETLTTKFFSHPQKKYLPVVKPKLEHISGEQLQHIDEVLSRLSDKTAKELSAVSHRDMPWIATKDGQQIEYQLAMYRTTETSVKEPSNEL